MAIPVIASSATGRTTTSDTTSHSITMPSGITAGDLLVVIFSVDGDPSVDAPSDWVKLGYDWNGANVTGGIFFKFAAGSDTCTITTGPDGGTSTGPEQSSHVSLRITGAGGGVTGAEVDGSSTNSNPPLHTRPYNEDTLWLATRAGDSTVLATAQPTNFTNVTSIAAAGTGGASTNVASRSLAAASQDPGTFTSATEQWVCFTLAIGGIPHKLRELNDNFTDGVVDVGKWAGSTGTFSETGGRARVPSNDTNLDAFGSAAIYALQGSRYQIKTWPAALSGAGAGQLVITYLLLYADLNYNDYIEYGYDTNGGYIYAYWKANPTNDGTADDLFDITTPLAGDGTIWLQVRESGGIVYFDSSINGTTWTTHYGLASPPSWATSPTYTQELDFSARRDAGTANNAEFDDLNLGPLVFFPGKANEVDTALAVTKTRSRNVGLASEADSALTITRVKTRAVGLATSSNTALPVTVVQVPNDIVVHPGFATETDSALAATRIKTRSAGLASEADAALAVARIKSRTTGLASETDVALAVGGAKAATVGLAVETDAALAVTQVKTITVGLASETSSALAVGKAKTRAVGLAVESDVALAALGSKTRGVGLAWQGEVALPITTAKSYALGMATESDTALAITVSGEQVVPIGLAIESDAARAVTGAKNTALGLAVEFETSLVVSGRKTLLTGLTVETDTALSSVGGKTAAVGSAIESDEAPPALGIKAAAVFLAAESDTAQGTTGVKVRPVGLALSVESALPLIGTKVRDIGLAVESESAHPVTATRVIPVGLAASLDVALPVTAAKIVAVEKVIEVDGALAITIPNAELVGLAIEPDVALAASGSKVRSVGLAHESDVALPVAATRIIAVGLATESSTALAVSLVVTTVVSVGLAHESDAALAVGKIKRRVVGLATESDTARPVFLAKTVPIGLASSIEVALAVSGSKTRALGLAGQGEVALSTQAHKTALLGLAFALERAYPATPAGDQFITVGMASETNLALPVLPLFGFYLTEVAVIADDLLACLCSALELTSAGPACRCSLSPGPVPVADICEKTASGNGQATVNLVRMFDYTDFPSVDTEPFRITKGRAAELTMTVLRCAPTVDGDGAIPTGAELDAAVALLVEDAEAMRCAMECCLSTTYRTWTMGEYVMLQPSGGCMGGSLSVVVSLTDRTCPEPVS